MSRYTRLREPKVDTSDTDLFEVTEAGAQYFVAKQPRGAAAAEAELAHQKAMRDDIYCVPSTAILSSSKLHYSKGSADNFPPPRPAPALQQQQQNIENGNPNVSASNPTPQQVSATAAAVRSHSSTASGASLQEHGVVGAARVGSSTSSRWKAATCELYRRDDARQSPESPVDDDAPGPPPPSPGGEWAASNQRVSSHRDAAALQQQQQCQETCAAAAAARVGNKVQLSQPHDHRSCALHSSCNAGRHSQRFTKNPLGQTKENFRVPTPAMHVLGRKTLAAAMNCMSDSEYGGCLTQDNNRSAAVQRSYSTRDVARPRPEMSTDNWRHQSANKSAHHLGSSVGDGRHRVSFSLAETHEQLEQQKQREKWREPLPPIRKGILARNHHPDQPLRLNYEQPGFVECKKDHSGKPYTIYEVTNNGKECPKGSSGRQHGPHLVRAFSLRDNQTSNYTRISRAFSMNAASGRDVLPVECVTCGTGMGIVILGFPGNEDSFCQTCKPLKKKKGIIMGYCRKLLRLSKKGT